MGKRAYELTETTVYSDNDTVAVDQDGWPEAKYITTGNLIATAPVTAGVFNVKTYGAKGDGSTNDKAAIQAAIDACYTAGGGTVFFPTGTYIVDPAGGRIVLKSGVSLSGQGDSSVLKIKNAAGNFEVWFAPADGYSLTNAEISHLKFDTNMANNPSATCQSADGYRQRIIRAIYQTVNVWVHHCTFLYSNNALDLSNYTDTPANIRVTNCRFRYETWSGHPFHDNSCIYIDCRNFVVANNVFEGNVYTDQAAYAYGAIETHDGPGTVVGNIVDWFRVGSYILPTVFSDAGNITFIGNVIKHCQYGVQMWGYTYTLRNVTVSGNTIQVAQKTWGTQAGSECSGIEFLDNSSCTADFENISIIGNTISFEDEGAGRAAATPEHMAGIKLNSRGGKRGIDVIGNVIYDAPTIGIKLTHSSANPLGSVGYGIDISHNILVNPGQNVQASNTYRTGFFVLHSHHNLQVKDNLIVDVNATFRGYRAYYLAPASDSTDIVAEWNRYYSVNGAYLTYVNAYVHHTVKHMSGTTTWDPASVADGAMVSTTVTVAGAVQGDVVAAGFDAMVHAGWLISGYVSAADTVTVVLFNKTGGTRDPGLGVVTVDVWRH
jgi:hypothetical protein